MKDFGNKNREVSFTLTYLGDLYKNMGNLEKALEYYQKAIISNTDNFNNENVYINPSIKDLDPEFNKFVTLYKKAYTLYDIYLMKNPKIHMTWKLVLKQVNWQSHFLNQYWLHTGMKTQR